MEGIHIGKGQHAVSGTACALHKMHSAFRTHARHKKAFVHVESIGGVT